jgi:ATP-binding protein involved in chromosome partitioning
MSLNKDQITDVLRTIDNPAADGDLVASGALQWVAWCDTYGSVKLSLPPGVATSTMDQIARVVHGTIAAAANSSGGRLDSLIVEFVDHAGSVAHTARFGQFSGGTKTPAAASDIGHRPIGGLGTPPAKPASQQPTPQGVAPSIPGIRRAIAVGAGKGGVGKSTVALNLAVGLARKGHAVGLLDGDIYGPSMPTMLDLGAMDQATLGGRLVPFRVHGIKAITIGKLVDADRPLIWRGPMAHGAFKQLLEQTDWGELDYLIIDLPPGTGDIALTMAQQLSLTGAVVVCTPQKVAQDDATRATRMFQQLGVEVLGVVENMSSFIGDDGKDYDLFGKGGAEMMAQRLGVPFLGAIPITMALRVNSDEGDPTANFIGTDPAGTRLAAALTGLTDRLESQVALASLKAAGNRPVLKIS